jgi:hypothetical protein
MEGENRGQEPINGIFKVFEGIPKERYEEKGSFVRKGWL